MWPASFMFSALLGELAEDKLLSATCLALHACDRICDVTRTTKGAGVSAGPDFWFVVSSPFHMYSLLLVCQNEAQKVPWEC